MIVIMQRKRSQMNTVVAPCRAVPSPHFLVLACFWHPSWNVPACCFTKTPHPRLAAHCFSSSNNLLFVLIVLRHYSTSVLMCLTDEDLCVSVCECVFESAVIVWFEICVFVFIHTPNGHVGICVGLCVHVCVFPSLRLSPCIGVGRGSYLSRPATCYCSGRQTELVCLREEMSRHQIVSSFYTDYPGFWV